MGQFDEFAMPDMAADYTMTLGNMISLGYDTPEKLHLDSKHYDIFDEKYRDTLNYKIVQRYCMREIGQETPQQFIFMLGRKMNENMPYFNQLYESTLKKFDPLTNTGLETITDTDNVSQSSGKSSGDQHSTTKSDSQSSSDNHQKATSANSETPQTRVEDFNNYVTSANQTESDAKVNSHDQQTSSTDSNSHTSTDFTHQNDTGKSDSKTTGYNGLSPSQLLQQWRDTMINIDIMVLDSLEPCFMQIWGSPDDMNVRQLRDLYPYYR